MSNNTHDAAQQSLSSPNRRLPWHDYPPSSMIPDTTTHLRIGLNEHQQLLQGATRTTIVVPDKAFSNLPSRTRPGRRNQGNIQQSNLQQVQIYLPVVSTIGNFAFCKCRQVEKVEFVMKPPKQEEAGEEDEELEEENAPPPSRLVSIGNYAFTNCNNLKSVIGLEQAADTLEEIGEYAFAHCSLVNVDFLPHLRQLKVLRAGAFEDNQALVSVDLSNALHLTELQSETFFDCRALSFIRLPPNLLKIGNFALRFCCALEQIDLPTNLQSIGCGAFSGCIKLKFICLPASLRQARLDCFHQCDKLSRDGLASTRIPLLKSSSQLFLNSPSLSALELPNPVPRQQWPLILGELCIKRRGIEIPSGGIRDAKNRNSIIWNFLCQNMAQFFMV